MEPASSATTISISTGATIATEPANAVDAAAVIAAVSATSFIGISSKKMTSAQTRLSSCANTENYTILLTALF